MYICTNKNKEMKLIKEQDHGFSTTKTYDLGKSTSKGFGDNTRKILVVIELETGQETQERYIGSYTTDYDGEVRINKAVKPYSTKVKGYDY